MAWIKTRERLPERPGAYRVKRRGIGRRPAFEDECQFTPPRELVPGLPVSAELWQTARGVEVLSVVEWYEEDAFPSGEGGSPKG